MSLKRNIALSACAVVAFAASSGRLLAEDTKANAVKEQMWQAVAQKLGLNEQQRDSIRKECEQCEKEACPIEHQIWANMHSECEAVKNQLNEQQQTTFKDSLKAMRQKELQKMAAKLELNDDQKQKLQTICEQYEEKFNQIAAQGGKDEKTHQQYRDMQAEFIAAVRSNLTAEQQTKLPFVIEEEHQRWRNPETRRAAMKTVLDQVEVSQEKRAEIKKICESYNAKIQPLMTELSNIRKTEREKIDNQLTAEQREKLREIRKASGSDDQQQQ